MTKCVHVGELTDQETIGGGNDSSSALTKRVLVLTESAELAGQLGLGNIRGKILAAYGEQERTRGRHILSFCNDIARYYRTLCIEYKAKVDVHQKDWCTRNVKLRHSRKFWYFSTAMAIAALAERHSQDSSRFQKGLVTELDRPPVLRLVAALQSAYSVSLGEMLERYAFFLEFMAGEDRRRALSRVKHDSRYEVRMDNPFPTVKLNSDVMHREIVRVIEELPQHIRHRVLNWFLL